MKSHEFEFHGGRKDDPDRRGKSTWPDVLTIDMDRFHAWDLIHSVLHQLRHNGESDMITYSVCGELDYNLDDE